MSSLKLERRQHERRSRQDRRTNQMTEMFNWGLDNNVFIDLRKYSRRGGLERRTN